MVANCMARTYLESGKLTQVLNRQDCEQFLISVMYPQTHHLLTSGAHFRRLVSVLHRDPMFQAG